MPINQQKYWWENKKYGNIKVSSIAISKWIKFTKKNNCILIGIIDCKSINNIPPLALHVKIRSSPSSRGPATLLNCCKEPSNINTSLGGSKQIKFTKLVDQINNFLATRTHLIWTTTQKKNRKQSVTLFFLGAFLFFSSSCCPCLCRFFFYIISNLLL